MSVSINGTTGVTFTDASVQNTAATGFGFKNRIINGAMVIDQRYAGAATANTISGYTVDRWAIAQSPTTGKVVGQQNAGAVTPPTGFNNYFGITSQSAFPIVAGSIYTFIQAIEGFNFADMAWGTANAKTITLSFQVYSSLTGTFGGSLGNGSSFNRSYPFTYSIPTANTWTSISVTVAGDTTGTWVGATNGIGVYVNFGLGVGSTYSGTAGAWAAADYRSATGATSVVGTNNATFYITGVQLEKGSTATSFDYRPYGTELQLCQRYFQQIAKGNTTNILGTASYFSATRADGVTFLPVSMRSTPAFSVVTGASYYRVYLAGTSYSCSTVTLNATNSDFSKITYYNNTDFSGMANGAGWWESQNASASIALTAEL